MRLVHLLQSKGVAIRWGKTVLKNKITNYEFAVLEPDPRHVWTDAERQKWQFEECGVCGSVGNAKTGGTFRPKEFERSVFESGRVLVYGIEVPRFYMNEATKALLASAAPKGLEFHMVGSFR
jgi:hypothetical protein